MIIDNCQALFAPPTNASATIYSPRTLAGVPDGGLLMTSGWQVDAPEHEDIRSSGRMTHLLKRMAYTAQDGYADYLESESSLSDTTPLMMSPLTQRILASIDMAMVAQRRRDNFAALADRLNKYNVHEWQLDSESVPMCYPLVASFDTRGLKKHLVGRGIYIPTYWPDSRSRGIDGIEHQLRNCLLPIPCDQRYSLEHMNDLAGEIVSSLATHASM